MRGWSRAIGLLLLAPVLAGCLAPAEDPPTVPEGTTPAGDGGDLDGEGEAPGREGSGGSTAPAVGIRLNPAPLTAPGRLAVNATIVLADGPAPGPALRIHWTLNASTLAEESLAWAADATPTRVIERAWDATPGEYTLSLVAQWDGAEDAAASAGLAVAVPEGVRLVLNASAEYTEDVDQPSFRSEWIVPFLPWDEESALDVLHRAAGLHGFPYDAQYHADLEAHYVEMVNGTEEVWLVDGFVSRSWIVLLDGALAGSAIDHVVPASGQELELRYVQCYATGQCDGTG